ncbi:MAG: AAA family ATPase [Immundisolibacteraceae bacterium]|nr:AAA family ATPase [Immundisolibacteraceae bacterium]
MTELISPLAAHCITFANEKGGTGKSTLAVHLLISLQAQGYRVAAVDLDFRQRTLSRYIENRQQHHPHLPSVEVLVPPLSELESRSAAAEQDQSLLRQSLDQLAQNNQFVIIDSPGSDSPRSRLAMSLANTLVTPLNDSFVDLDLLGRINPESNKVDKLSFFSETIWQARQHRALAKLPALEWFVTRNRLTQLDARNKRRVNSALEELQHRAACRYISGLSERVIYRELFPQGLTLVDLGQTKQSHQQTAKNLPKLTTSHLAARQELRSFIEALELPQG